MEKGYNVQVGGENYWDLREPAEWTIGTGIKGYALIPTIRICLYHRLSALNYLCTQSQSIVGIPIDVNIL